MITSGVVASAFLMTPMGVLADRAGKRPLVVLGGLVVAAGMFLFTYLNRPWEFYAVSVVLGIGGGMALPAVMAMVVVISGEKKRHGNGHRNTDGRGKPGNGDRTHPRRAGHGRARRGGGFLGMRGFYVYRHHYRLVPNRRQSSIGGGVRPEDINPGASLNGREIQGHYQSDLILQRTRAPWEDCRPRGPGMLGATSMATESSHFPKIFPLSLTADKVVTY